jgi:hypothetical protein
MARRPAYTMGTRGGAVGARRDGEAWLSHRRSAAFRATRYFSSPCGEPTRCFDALLLIAVGARARVNRERPGREADRAEPSPLRRSTCVSGPPISLDLPDRWSPAARGSSLCLHPELKL